MNLLKNSLFFTILITSLNAYSYQCINKLTNTPFQDGAQTIRIPIQSKIQAGENIFANVGDYISCKNDEPWAYVDTLFIKPYGIRLGNKLRAQGFSGGGMLMEIDITPVIQAALISLD